MKDPKRDELPLKSKHMVPHKLAARANKALSPREYLRLREVFMKKSQRFAET